jgi:hypothetical protein
MASGEDQALKILQEQNSRLTEQLQAQSVKLAEYEDLVPKLTKERDELKTQPEASARIAELEARIRDRNHFDRFAELAKGEKAKDSAVKALWKLSDYKAEADEPDEAALKGILKKLKTEADYAFEPDPADTTTAKAVRENSRTKYGLEMKGAEPSGGGRAERNKGGDGTIVTAEMRADPKFMLDPRNKEIIRDAAIGGRFR